MRNFKEEAVDSNEIMINNLTELAGEYETSLDNHIEVLKEFEEYNTHWESPEMLILREMKLMDYTPFISVVSEEKLGELKTKYEFILNELQNSESEFQDVKAETYSIESEVFENLTIIAKYNKGCTSEELIEYNKLRDDILNGLYDGYDYSVDLFQHYIDYGTLEDMFILNREVFEELAELIKNEELDNLSYELHIKEKYTDGNRSKFILEEYNRITKI